MMDRYPGRAAAERTPEPRPAAAAQHTFARRIDCADSQRPRNRAPAGHGRGTPDLGAYAHAGRFDRY